MADQVAVSSSLDIVPTNEDHINFCRLSRIVLENIPDVLRTIFKERIKAKYTTATWNDNPKSGQWFFKEERFKSHLVGDQRRLLKSGESSRWDTSLLVHVLLYSSFLLLVDRSHEIKVTLMERGRKLEYQSSRGDYKKGDTILCDIGEKVVKKEVKHVTATYIILKYPITEHNLPTVFPVFKCGQDWLKVDALSNIRNTEFAHCSDASINADSLKKVVEEVAASYHNLGISPIIIETMRSLRTVPYIDEKIYQKAMYYRNKWCEEIKMVVALKEVVDCHDSTIEDMQQTLKKIEEDSQVHQQHREKQKLQMKELQADFDQTKREQQQQTVLIHQVSGRVDESGSHIKTLQEDVGDMKVDIVKVKEKLETSQQKEIDGSGASNQNRDNPEETVSMPERQDNNQDPIIRDSEYENSAVGVQSSNANYSVNASCRFPEGNTSTNLRAVAHELDTEFTAIVLTLLEELNEKKISVKDIGSKISFPPSFISFFISPLWGKIKKNIDLNRDSMEDLFNKLHLELWNYLDYNLLKNLIDIYGSECIRTRMQNYVTNIEYFKHNTTVKQFFESNCWRKYNGNIPEYINMMVKFEKKDFTLADLDSFRYGLTAKPLPFLTEYASWIFYRDFTEGCIQVSWFIPELLSPSLRKNIEVLRPLFIEYGVCLVKLEEDSIYSVDYEQGELSNDEKKSSSSQMDSNKVPQFPAPVVHPSPVERATQVVPSNPVPVLSQVVQYPSQQQAVQTPQEATAQIESSISDVESLYQHYVSLIPENRRFKLEWNIDSDQHIRRMAERMTGWEEKYSLFKLDNIDVHNIKRGANRDNRVLQRIEVLQKWRSRYVDISYGCLLFGFAKARFKNCAQELISIIRNDD